MFLSCFLAAEKVRLKWRPQLYRENRKKFLGRCRAPSLIRPCSDQYQRFDVVFESSAWPKVFYQLSLTGNMSGPYLRGEERRGEERVAAKASMQSAICFRNTEQTKFHSSLLHRNGGKNLKDGNLKTNENKTEVDVSKHVHFTSTRRGKSSRTFGCHCMFLCNVGELTLKEILVSIGGIC